MAVVNLRLLFIKWKLQITVLSSRKCVIMFTYSEGPMTSLAWGPVGHCTSGRPLNPPLVAESGRQTPEAREISREAGDPLIISFADYSQSSASQVLQEKARSAADWSAQHMHALFSVCSLRDDNVITSKHTWKLKAADFILEPSEYFCQISSKSIHIISSYTVSKLGRFLRHSVGV